jgi:hypothetical protein
LARNISPSEVDTKKQRRSAVGEPHDVEQEIIDLYLTDAELSKTVAKVCMRCLST